MDLRRTPQLRDCAHANHARMHCPLDDSSAVRIPMVRWSAICLGAKRRHRIWNPGIEQVNGISSVEERACFVVPAYHVRLPLLLPPPATMRPAPSSLWVIFSGAICCLGSWLLPRRYGPGLLEYFRVLVAYDEISASWSFNNLDF